MQGRKKNNTNLTVILIFTAMMLISGCSSMVLMNPKGQIGVEQRSLILSAMTMMLIIVIPVVMMAIIFFIRYRSSNTTEKYNPNWCHSSKIEVVIWLVPILIILILAVITWRSTYALDPRKPILSNKTPIIIDVIALDWKWLFIYPEQGVATINEIAFPMNVPIKFNITSNSVMNSFFIPQLGGQIYAMPGMNSTLNLIANEPGRYKGISSNFSGHGFSGMKFTAIVTQDETSFYQWMQIVKSSFKQLNTMSDYELLAIPSEYHPIEYFSNVKPNLFHNVMRKFIGKNVLSSFPLKHKQQKKLEYMDINITQHVD